MGDIEELIDNVLVGQHPKMRERCIVDRIVSVLEAFGAYDAAGVNALLVDRCDEVDAKLAEAGAARVPMAEAGVHTPMAVV